MKNCCFCWSPVGGDAVTICDGWLYPDPRDEPQDALSFLLTKYPEAEYAHEECFERAKTAYRTASAAVATMRGGR